MNNVLLVFFVDGSKLATSFPLSVELDEALKESAADMTKKAMIELHKEGITPHIQVHDELDISVDNNADKIKDIMESAVELEVPNKVDYESGTNWGTIK